MTPIPITRTPALVGWKPPTPPSAAIEVAEQRETNGPRAGDTDATAVIDATADEGAHALAAESSARKIFDADTLAYRDQFDREVDEATRLAGELVTIESELDSKTEEFNTRLAPKKLELILSGLRAARLVHEDKVSNEAAEEFIRAAGIRPHGNATIPYSRLIRAIFARVTEKKTDSYKRMQQRATTFASAIGYALQEKMSDEEFLAELNAARKPREYHGIEYLAAKGRAARDEDEATQGRLPVSAMSYRVAGDFTGVPRGSHLMCVEVIEGADEMAGALLDVSEPLLHRAITADEKARLKARLKAA